MMVYLIFHSNKIYRVRLDESFIRGKSFCNLVSCFLDQNSAYADIVDIIETNVDVSNLVHCTVYRDRILIPCLRGPFDRTD